MGDFLTDTIFREEIYDRIITMAEFTITVTRILSIKQKECFLQKWILIRSMRLL